MSARSSSTKASAARTLVWFRGKDLRLSDHVPLCDAIERGEMIPLFVVDPFFFEPRRAADLPYRMQFLLDGLSELAQEIARLGSELLLVRGKSVDVVPQLAKRWSVDRVVAHRWVEPFARARDRKVAARLHVPLVLFEGETLWPPGTLRTGSDTPFSVFTPFKRAFLARATIEALQPRPESLPPLPADVMSTLPSLESRTTVPSPEDLGLSINKRIQQGGESHAFARLQRFCREAAAHYDEHRDRMDLAGTSRLSADLKFGTISARQVWHASHRELGDSRAGEVFRNELIWREFTHSTLWDRPEVLEQPYKSSFEGFPWRDDETAWRAWTSGTTGYPVVDAASRQLLQEGFVHNRARMIAASFLTKHLLISYQRGEAHYMKYLTDGDWAQNNSGWQWSAGCGCDAQPYFRVFNPMTQGEKFDPQGDYVRRYVPELSNLETKYIHAPWTAPPLSLRQADITLGATYPHPIVEHRHARERFLALAKQYLKNRK